MSSEALQEIFVIVPASNEQALIAPCLQAVKVARDTLRKATGIRGSVIAVCDACTDNTVAIAQRLLSAERDYVVECDFNNVGRARALGAHIARSITTHVTRTAPSKVWYVFTDADTTVPPDWLCTHARHARSGVDAILGVISIDPQDTDPRVLHAFNKQYASKLFGPSHGHVHGANMSMRADIYWATGGFQPARLHEDQALISALEQRGGDIKRDAALTVLTSGRTHGRTPAGVADDIKKITAGLAKQASPGKPIAAAS